MITRDDARKGVALKTYSMKVAVTEDEWTRITAAVEGLRKSGRAVFRVPDTLGIMLVSMVEDDILLARTREKLRAAATE